jgi:hypothetical protein
MVDSIQEEKGKGKARKYLVRWVGYDSPSWEPAEFLEDNEALNKWLIATEALRNDKRQLPKGFTLRSEE